MKKPEVTPDQYFAQQPSPALEVCLKLQSLADAALPKAVCRLYHGAPVWFLDENPLVGVTAQASGAVQLLFWAGQSFEEPGLKALGKFKAAEARYSLAAELSVGD